VMAASKLSNTSSKSSRYTVYRWVTPAQAVLPHLARHLRSRKVASMRSKSSVLYNKRRTLQQPVLLSPIPFQHHPPLYTHEPHPSPPLRAPRLKTPTSASPTQTPPNAQSHPHMIPAPPRNTWCDTLFLHTRVLALFRRCAEAQQVRLGALLLVGTGTAAAAVTIAAGNAAGEGATAAAIAAIAAAGAVLGAVLVLCVWPLMTRSGHTYTHLCFAWNPVMKTRRVMGRRAAHISHPAALGAAALRVRLLRC
jgi:hypothetical protein